MVGLTADGMREIQAETRADSLVDFMEGVILGKIGEPYCHSVFFWFDKREAHWDAAFVILEARGFKVERNSKTRGDYNEMVTVGW